MEQLTEPLEEFFKDLKQKWRAMQEQEPFYNVFMGFIHAIDWKEPWILGMLAFHVTLFITVIGARRNTTVQATAFAVAMGIVYFAEQLNRLGAVHWERFATQNYFDPRGVFITAVVSGPLLLIMFIVLVNYLLACSRMLIQAKRRELIYKAKQKAKAAKQEGKKEQ